VITGDVLSATNSSPEENIAVKDPSVVRYNGHYHLFYTARSVVSPGEGEKYRIGCGYRSAATIEGLRDAKRISVDSLAGRTVIAPQVFYFEPQQLWYLIAHSPAKAGDLSRLEPVYLTNPDIENPYGWSKAKPLLSTENEKFRIDFWVICDEKTAYLFYAYQTGKLFRLSCSIGDFPEGFNNSKEELALDENHFNEPDGWKFFEAAHIYRIKESGTYLALLEGARPHPLRKKDVDARNRFIFAMTADNLNGKWQRPEKPGKAFFAEASDLYDPDGNKTSYTAVSHPELIRSGYNQMLEINDLHLRMIFQTLNGTEIPDTFQYAALPWQLMLMQNFR